MNQVVAGEQINAVVIPRSHFPQSFFGSYIHIRADHQIARAIMLTTDIGITRGSLDTGMLSVTKDRIACQQIVIVKPVATQRISRPGAPTIVHMTIQITIVALLQITLLGYCRHHKKLKERKNK